MDAALQGGLVASHLQALLSQYGLEIVVDQGPGAVYDVRHHLLRAGSHGGRRRSRGARGV